VKLPRLRPLLLSQLLIFACGICIFAVGFCILAVGCATSPRRTALAEEYYNLGNAYLSAGQWDRAVDFFTRAVETDPELLAAHSNLSLALIRSGRTEEALEVLAPLLRRDPENIGLLEIRAYALYRADDLEEAESTYSAILELSPENRAVRYNRGFVLWKLERREDAASQFAALLEYPERDELALDSLYNLSLLWDEEGQVETVTGYLEQYLQWRPDDTDARLRLARGYAAQELYLQALETYEDLIELEPDNAEALFETATILLTTVEDPDSGLRSLRRALTAGYEDSNGIEELLAEPSLLDREAVEAILRERNLLAAEAPGSPADPQQPETLQPSTFPQQPGP
jgi:tetratricopeptide (TPR) repeat protein